MINRKSAVIFGLSASKKLAASIAKKLHMKLGDIIIKHFADGETMVKPVDSIRDKDVYVVQSTSKPVNENLMELLIALDSLRRASAHSITVLTPYFGYSRQDRKTDAREPITCKLASKIIESAGADRVAMVDLHASQTQGFFEIPVDNISAFPSLLNAIQKDHGFKNSVIVSPDYGSVKRCRKLSKAAGLPMAILDKRRPAPNVAEITNILGDIKDKNCIIVDDMIDTGGTLVAACEILRKKGAKKIICAATHGLFSGDAAERFTQALRNNVITDLYVSNTLDTVYDANINRLKIVDLSSILAELIKIYEGKGYACITELYKHSKFDKKDKR